MSFAAPWMGLEIIILSEVRQRQIPYDITYMWNIKYGTREYICETETDSQTQRTDLQLSRERGSGGREELDIWHQQIQTYIQDG